MVNDAGADAWALVATLFMGDQNHDRFHDACAAIDIGPPALKLLLSMEPGVANPMRVFADKLRCDASWVTALFDDLEKKGFVERRVQPTDRRVKAIVITKQGLAAQAKARKVLHKPPPAMDALSAAEQEQLRDLMQKLVDAAS